jgi:hypothetical protein
MAEFMANSHQHSTKKSINVEMQKVDKVKAVINVFNFQ